MVLDALAALLGVFFLYALMGGGPAALVALLALVAVFPLGSAAFLVATAGFGWATAMKTGRP